MMLMRDKKPIWMCDGKRECHDSIGCFINGGPCHCTSDEEHAVQKEFIDLNKLYGDDRD